MRDDPRPLKRGLFGYSREAVDRMTRDRDTSLHQAEVRVQAAESRAARLDAELQTLREEHDALAARLAELDRGAHPTSQGEGGPEERDGPGQLTSRFLTEELASVLAAAEEAAGRIVERARASSEQQIAEADRMWREAQSQMARLASWRDRVEPVTRTAQSKIGEVRAKIEDVPDMIRKALSPLADSIAGLDGDLAEVAMAANPPLMVAPTGLEDAEAEEEAGAPSMAVPGQEPEAGAEAAAQAGIRWDDGDDLQAEGGQPPPTYPEGAAEEQDEPEAGSQR
jgi:hypothetical protein